MSWQDYEYGPADDGADYYVDAGWLTPDEAEELYADRDHYQRAHLVLFVVLLLTIAGGFA